MEKRKDGGDAPQRWEHAGASKFLFASEAKMLEARVSGGRTHSLGTSRHHRITHRLRLHRLPPRGSRPRLAGGRVQGLTAHEPGAEGVQGRQSVAQEIRLF